MDYFTLEELKDAVQFLPFYGETLFEIHKKENGETHIVILDEEQERFIDVFGDITYGEHHKISKLVTLHMNEQGLIVCIEHPYRSITKTNKKQMSHLVSLLGARVVF